MTLRFEVRRSAYPLSWPRLHRARVWARRLQRVSGLALAAFAVWHVFQVVGAAHDRTRLAAMISTLYHPAFIGLVFAALGFHTLNGLRTIFLDLGLMSGRRQAGAILFAALGTVLLAAAAVVWRLR
jgi:succinate dehydrogenase/fumarate reductase cytochrome b subunit